MNRLRWIATAALAAAVGGLAGGVPESKPDEKPAESPPRALKVPDGFVVERVAGPPLIEHPMNGCFDERGRLFLTEAAGKNLNGDELLKQLPNSIKVLEPANADGRFDKAAVFADQMTFPSGVLWHAGALFSTAYPALWRLEEGGRRTEVVGKFGSIGNAADLHGPQLGPDGLLYFCDGRNGHDIKQPDGYALKGRAAGVYRCRLDGSRMERVCTGGMDNPVEVAFTPAGEPLVCVNLVLNSPRHDAILLAADGAAYPYNDSVYSEFQRTGDLMPLTGDLGWVAVSSLIRYRGDAFGDAFRDCFFTAQFNPHRIQRHVVERAGAGFKVNTENFVTCDDAYFHPTGLVEDADGSLLVIDTGGWFRNGCPQSQIAKPHIMGGVYRIHKKDAPKRDDPRGLRLAWDKAAAADLVKRLDDPRFAVADRAVAEAAHRGDAAPLLAERLADRDRPRDGRLNALWALTRLDSADARQAVRGALADADVDVRIAAAHAASLNRDAEAVPALIKMTADADLAARRQAATALGRLRKAEAVPALLAALHDGGGDRWLEHSLIYGLIQIADRNATRCGLADASTAVQRGAMIALDQMGDGLTREEVVPLLASTDPATARAALGVLTSRPAWAKETLGLLERWLAEDAPSDARRDLIRGVVAAFAGEPDVEDLVARALRREKTSSGLRLLLLEAMARTPLDSLPATWAAEVRWQLDSDDERVVRQAVACLRSARVADFAPALLKLAQEEKRPKDLRVAALAAAAPHLKKAESWSFQFLCGCLADDQPLLRLSAADALGQSPLDRAQLKYLAGRLAEAGPLEAPRLVAAFEQSNDASVGRALTAALEKSPGSAGLSPGALRAAVRNYPEEVKAAADALLKKLDADAATQKDHLTDLQSLLDGGDADKGRLVFFNGRTACAACHTVNGHGGRVGPELSKIGGIRAPADLLESVVYPSATIVRGYETYVVETKQGQIIKGLLSEETADAVVLKTAERAEVRVPRAAIDAISQSKLSIMPQGLEGQMTRDEMRDLIAFLRSLK
jgi:putative membrane-bound dehydrogenase-like protein